MAWMALRSSALDSRKIYKFAEKLRRPDSCAFGHIVPLWLWATKLAEDGYVAYWKGWERGRYGIHDIDLSSFHDEEIAQAANWTGDPSRFVVGLIKSEFMTPGKILVGGGLIVGHIDDDKSTRLIRMRRAPRRAVLERDGFRCVYCGRENDLTLDHLMPYSRGGKETLDNLVACCRSCNSRKSDRTPSEAGMAFRPDWDGIGGSGDA